MLGRRFEIVARQPTCLVFRGIHIWCNEGRDQRSSVDRQVFIGRLSSCFCDKMFAIGLWGVRDDLATSGMVYSYCEAHII